jgi:alpha-ketoglutarate-dependent taurine dioxygenase
MNYSLHPNGWTACIDIDLRTCTQEDINSIAKLISTNVVVVFKNQFLTVNEELRLLHMFKDPTKQFDKDHHGFNDYAVDPDAFICRVTAGLRNGKPGMGGWPTAHEWHVDDAPNPERKDLLYMHGVEGMQGSRTSFTNSLIAYEHLDDNIKTVISNLHCIYGNTYAPHDPDFTEIKFNDKWVPSIVRENVAGKLGLYYIPFQMKKFIELSQEVSDSLKEILTDHIFSKQYVYHHDWEDGDIVISDQWYGLHKRWAFDKMDERLLHRASISYPEQNYG